MKRISILLLAGLVAVPAAMAQTRAGTTAATFLTIGTGAKGSSLGQAYTAIATGPDALFWNPGGASRAYLGRYRGGAFFTRHDWVAGINYNAAAVVVPAGGSGVIGLSIAQVDYGSMDVRTVSQPNGTGETFDAGDLSFGVTYSMPLTPQFNFGGTAKFVQQRIRDMSASTVAFDFGFVLATDYLNGLQIAASIMNFGGKMQMDGINSERNIDIDPVNTGSSESIPVRVRMDEWDIPISFKFGVALPVVRTGNVSVLVLADANQTNDNDLNSDFGGMLTYATNTITFDARLGYKDAFLDDRVDSHLSYGVGLDVQVSKVRFGFDFAYVPFDLLNDVRMFDFRIHF
jgi:hypothetical protein